MIYHKSKQVGFIEHGEANIDKIMHNGNCVFNQGFDNDTSGTDSVTLDGTIGKDLMDWSIVGNTVQNGTPSPENIVEVKGVGDYDTSTGMYKIPVVSRGKNLCPPLVAGLGLNTASGVEISNINGFLSDYIPVDFDINPEYVLSNINYTLHCFIAAYNENKEFVGRSSGKNYYTLIMNDRRFTGGSPTAAGKIKFLRVYQFAILDEKTSDFVNELTLVSDSVEQPYTPYRPPITTTQYLPTPLMANERLTPTARDAKWGKWVFTGDESFSSDRELETTKRFYTNASLELPQIIGASSSTGSYSSHFLWKRITELNINDTVCFSTTNTNALVGQLVFRVPKNIANTTSEFKTWLKSEYDKGTPVTVWYQLANPTSEPVATNPIGTLRNEEKTIKGTTTIITTDTEVLPTQIEASYKSNKADYVVVNFATTDGNIFTTTDGDTYTIKMRKSQYDTMMTNELLNLLEVM